MTNEIQVCFVKCALPFLVELSIHNSAPSHFFDHWLIEAELQMALIDMDTFFSYFTCGQVQVPQVQYIDEVVD